MFIILDEEKPTKNQRNLYEENKKNRTLLSKAQNSSGLLLFSNKCISHKSLQSTSILREIRKRRIYYKSIPNKKPRYYYQFLQFPP